MIYDLHEKLLLNKPIKINGVGYFHNPTINEILDLDCGFKTYNQWISILCISKFEIQRMINSEEEVSSFDFIYFNCLNELMQEFQNNVILDENSIKNTVLISLSYFFKEDVNVGDGHFYIGNLDEGRIINKDVFDDIVYILKKQNYIKDKSDKKFKSDIAKQKYDELLKAREKIANFGKKEIKKEIIKDDLYKKSEWINIMSSLGAKHPSINLFNVGNLTIYQLIDQFKRINMIDGYSIAIDSLLAGANKEEVEIIHWSDDIKDKNEFESLKEYEGLI